MNWDMPKSSPKQEREGSSQSIGLDWALKEAVDVVCKNIPLCRSELQKAQMTAGLPLLSGVAIKAFTQSVAKPSAGDRLRMQSEILLIGESISFMKIQLDVVLAEFSKLPEIEGGKDFMGVVHALQDDKSKSITEWLRGYRDAVVAVVGTLKKRGQI